MLNRRFVFLTILILDTGGCRSLPHPAPDDVTSARATHALSILQGPTSATSARFSVVVPARARVAYAVTDGTVERAVPARRVRGEGGEYAVDQLAVDRLTLGTAYELIIRHDEEVWDRRAFRALDVGKAHGRVALISCMDDQMGAEARQMWPQVLGQAPDALLLIGDNVYADHVRAGPHWRRPGPADLWRRYVETRLELPLYYANPLVPTLATWDDHDFGYNDADMTNPDRDRSRDAFLAFFPQAEPGEGFARGPGVASWWRAFGVEWALTDNRYFRTPDKVESPAQSHFGPEQERWLLERLAAAEAPVLLTEGDQFFGGYHPFESYEGSHPQSFARALHEWRGAARVPVLFLSGDRHLSEIIRVPEAALGYPTYEVTSSGIHAAVFADVFKRHPGPHQLVGVAGQLNYSVLEVLRAEPGLLRLSVQAFGPRQSLLYQRTLTVKRP